MSADPRRPENTAAGRQWYLDVSGRRAGPFAWSVLVELAQAGALSVDDRVWRMGLASWSRATDLADLAPHMREPAPARTFARADAPGRTGSVRRRARLVGLCALPLLAVGTFLANHRADRITHERVNPSGESLAAFASRASAIEARYPFLAELRRIDPSGFAQADRAVRLGLRRRAPDDELNRVAADSASDIERERLADVGDGAALRLMVELRTAARGFKSSDPAQCVAILRPQSAIAPIRSTAALAAISPALAGLLDAPTGPRRQTLPGAAPDGLPVDPKLACDRLLLLYDAAVASSPDAGADFIRAMQSGAER
jgi:GYF domain 2